MTREFPEPVLLGRRTLLAGAGALGITVLTGCSTGADVRNSGAGRAAATLPEGHPRGLFFRHTEMAFRLPYGEWKASFRHLNGVEGKAFREEVKHTEEEWRQIRSHFTRLKQEDPDQILLLHFNGKAARPDFMPGAFFPGHWLYYAGTRLTQDAEPEGLTLHVAEPGLFSTDRPAKAGPDDIVIARPGAGGRPDFGDAEHLRIKEIHEDGTITLERAPRAGYPKGSHVAPHVRLRPRHVDTVMWAYNLSSACPRDSHDRTCADVLIDMIAGWFADDGEIAAYDGLEFDVLYFLPNLEPSGGGKFAEDQLRIDVDNDRHADAGMVDGRNLFGDGVTRFLAGLRRRLPGRFIMTDGWQPEVHPRSFRTLSGIESEGFPRLGDKAADEWSGGLNRHLFWNERGAKPKMHYIALKNVPADDDSMNDRTYRRLRLIFAAAMFTDAVVAQTRFEAGPSGGPAGQDGDDAAAEPGREAFDELLMGTALKRNWLGRPVAPAVHLAARARDLLQGAGTTWPAALVDRFGGTGARFARVRLPDGTAALRVTFDPSGGEGPASPDTGVPVRRFHLDGIHLRGAPLFVRFGVSCTPLPGFPREIGRRLVLRTTGPAGESEPIPAWSDADPFTPTFYFRSASMNRLVFEVEGEQPLVLTGLLATSAHDTMYREFEHGAVLANPSDHAAAFDLAALMPRRKFRRIEGHTYQQGGDGGVNDGRSVGRSVTLRARDGLALVKTDAAGSTRPR